MGNDAINWDEVPDIITKEQLYRLCHIGKAKAQYLLQNGLIPCEYTGKMTRCYKIKKEDVRTYLERRDQFPEDYSPPGRWYVCLRPPKSQEAPQEVAAEMRLFYERKLESYLDVIPARDIAALTGYGKTTINNWCRRNLLKSFRKGGVNLVPKVCLIDFFCSSYFRSVGRKTKWHKCIQREFAHRRLIRQQKKAGGAK